MKKKEEGDSKAEDEDRETKDREAEDAALMEC